MTDAQQTPPGWYPDANAPGGQRWWDGVQWTEHVSGAAPQPYAAAVPERAPEGTDTNTLWIWLVALVPLLGIASLFLIDFGGYMRAVLANPTSPSAGMAELFTPGYLLALLLGWGSAIAGIVFGYLDWRALKARGVPSPFHWAFGFFVFVSAGLVYPIGRSVVVKRRADGSMAPMVVAILVYVVVIIVSIVWAVVMLDQMFTGMLANPGLYS